MIFGGMILGMEDAFRHPGHVDHHGSDLAMVRGNPSPIEANHRSRHLQTERLYPMATIKNCLVFLLFICSRGTIAGQSVLTQGHDLPRTAALRTEPANQCLEHETLWDQPNAECQKRQTLLMEHLDQSPKHKTMRKELSDQCPKPNALRGKLVAVAASQVGVRELTGKNDGPEIRKYLLDVDLSEGYAYCAAGLTWCHNQLKIPNPQSAWSPDWFKANVVFRRNKPLFIPFESLPGQVAGFYSESKKRVSHVALIESESRQHYFTIEFNTNGAGSDDGEGVRRLIRKKASVYVIADHVGSFIEQGGQP